MPSTRKYILPALLGTTALLASVALASVAFAGGGGVGTGGGGGGGGTGDGGKNYVFPVPSKHTYGQGIGAGRGHQGQDLLATCGRKIVAARAGRVQSVASQSSAGNYIVIDGDGTGVDTVYMHLARRAIPREGSRVGKGEKIGTVGRTGNATACMLHFEKWSAPGYYEGGQYSRSVTKALKSWDKYS